MEVEYCTKLKKEVKNIYDLNGCIECTISNAHKNCPYKIILKK